jgi:hypothetical protein
LPRAFLGLELPLLALLAASDLATRTKALINSSFRIECHPGTRFRRAIAAKSLTVRVFSLAAVITGRTSGLACGRRCGAGCGSVGCAESSVTGKAPLPHRLSVAVCFQHRTTSAPSIPAPKQDGSPSPEPRRHVPACGSVCRLPDAAPAFSDRSLLPLAGARPHSWAGQETPIKPILVEVRAERNEWPPTTTPIGSGSETVKPSTKKIYDMQSNTIQISPNLDG